MTKEYDPTKPFNAQTERNVRGTWRAAKEWGIKLEKSGKRTAMTKYGPLWDDGGLKEMDATDGTGTKGYLHWLMHTFNAAAQDALAMNVDDLMEAGFVPYKLQDHK
jgi:phosphoribosylaminoimidazole (AIR) synthetase